MRKIDSSNKNVAWAYLMRQSLAKLEMDKISRQTIEYAVKQDDEERESILKVIELTSSKELEKLSSFCPKMYKKFLENGRREEAITIALCDVCTKSSLVELYNSLPTEYRIKALEEGIEAAQKALILAKQFQDSPLTARILKILGQGFYAFDELSKSIIALEKSHDIYKALTKKERETFKYDLFNTLSLLGNIYLFWGNLKKAAKIQHILVGLCQESTRGDLIASSEHIPIFYLHLSYIHRKEYDLEKAMYFANQSLKFFHKSRKYFNFDFLALPFIDTCNQLGLIFRDLGRETEAKRTFEKGILFYSRLSKNQKKNCAAIAREIKRSKHCLRRDIVHLNRITHLLGSCKKHAFLVGSGISVPQPSNAPCGGEFLKILIKQISPTDEVEKELLNLCDAERYYRASKFDFLRFEEIIQIIHDHVDPNLDILQALTLCSNHNYNHHILACLLAEGHIIITTNFDTLIEKACENLGIKYRVLIYEDDYLDYNNKVQKEDCREEGCIFKLHGSISRNKIDTRDSIIATLETVGKCGDTLELEPNKAKALTKVLQEQDLYVVGYSGYDDFDITPVLESVKSKRNLIWVQHSESEEHAKISSWQTLKKADLDCNGFFLRRREELLYRAGVKKVRPKSSIFIIVDDTFHFLSLLKNKYKMPPFEPRLSNQNNDHMNFIYNWTGDKFRHPRTKDILCADIFLRREKYEKTLLHYDSVLEHAKKSNDNHTMAWALNNKGIALEHLGQLDVAMNNYRRSLHIKKKEGMIKDIPYSFFNMGNICLRKGHYQTGISYLKKAIELFSRLSNIPQLARSSNSLALAYLKLDRAEEALELLHTANKKATEVGDLDLQCSIYLSMGDTLRSLRKPNEAIQFILKGIKLADKLGSNMHIAEGWFAIGTVCLCISAIAEATIATYKARRLFLKLGAEYEVDACNQQINLIHKVIDKYKPSYKDLARLIEECDDLNKTILSADFMALNLPDSEEECFTEPVVAELREKLLDSSNSDKKV